MRNSKPANVKPATKRNVKLSAKADKPAVATKRAAATVTEAKPDPRVARAERIAADRVSTLSLYHSFEANRVSVPVKPLSAFKPLPSHAHAIARNPSVRQAAAIAVAFNAAGHKLTSGAKAARVFEHDNKRVALENGVIADAISAGLVTVTGDTAETETLALTKLGATYIPGALGEKLLKQHKLL